MEKQGMDGEKWIVAERQPKDKADPKTLMDKWTAVAEDMALIPAKTVRLRVEAGQYVVEVSPEVFEEFC